MLGARPRETERVGFLEGIAADEFAGDLSGDGDDGDRIHHGVDEAGGEVGGARAGSGAADADLSSGASVAFGREGCIFLVADEDVTDLVVVEDVVEGEGHAAGVAEHALHALPGQALGQHFRAAHQS